jgi:hypothetical protein
MTKPNFACGLAFRAPGRRQLVIVITGNFSPLSISPSGIGFLVQAPLQEIDQSRSQALKFRSLGLRSPARIAAMIRWPVSPMMSETTSVSLTFICSRAICMCCVWLAA